MTERWTDRDPLREILVEMGRLPAPQRRFAISEIAPGWRVFGNEYELIGLVAGHVTGRVEDYLIVHRVFRGHFLSWWRAYVPVSAIGQAREGAVLLNVPRGWVGRMGWNRPPRKLPQGWQHS
jgi:hypothetical protein